MADTSSCLSLPFIQPSQAQKHVTHNEALRILDVLTQLGVLTDDQSEPPGVSEEGDRHIVGDAALGVWSGQEGRLALFENGLWQYFEPKSGWRAYVSARETMVVFDGTDWIDLDSAELQDIEGFGLGMTSQPTAPFAAKLNAALWTALYRADGGDGNLISTFNKERSRDDTGFVFQKDFATRGLLGLFGNDNLRLATSANGVDFQDGLVVDVATGIVDQPNLPRFKAATNFDNYTAADIWTTVGINDAAFNDQSAFDPGTNQFTAPVAGSYVFGATLTFKQNNSDQARLRGRFLLNGSDTVSGSLVEQTGPHVSERTTLQNQAMVLLSEGDTVELQGQLRDQDGYFMADQTVFWGYKVG
ncbi:DUF2793 domain-containing protein [uncultured Roseobacter sp.]|uniref:DUF2793 domain-containing protein n=1 Tax=uncultured Roseobacter sp. TaxID=114847 RepID=UPI002608692A|nr:DUF2793 domain-containing protein [uncultured Roseobacter sp.]